MKEKRGADGGVVMTIRDGSPHTVDTHIVMYQDARDYCMQVFFTKEADTVGFKPRGAVT